MTGNSVVLSSNCIKNELSANPGKIKSIMKVTLPKDRDRTSDDFLLMRDKVYEIFQMKEERNIEYFI